MSDDNEKIQQALFENAPAWTDVWKGMPAFTQKNQQPKHSVIVYFRSAHDLQEFAKLLNQTIYTTTPSIWYPPVEYEKIADKAYVSDKQVLPRYPIYIISKGRWESRLTSKALEALNVSYRIVIEPQEAKEYSAVIDPEKILILPFSNLGLGSIPARNWVWEHSISEGYDRHWILDDNISGFIRQHNNTRIKVKTGATFAAIENFVDRYTNVALAGMNYRFFAPTRDERVPPLYLNTRIYSCILIKNDIPYRWRGRYNEDTDLSLRALKDGWCTALFNAFKCNKAATMTMKGGNTDELYKEDGRLLMAKSLQEQHPDVVQIVEKWGRWQHSVNYKPFKRNKLILRNDVIISDDNDEYGMSLSSEDQLEAEIEIEESQESVSDDAGESLERFSDEPQAIVCEKSETASNVTPARQEKNVYDLEGDQYSMFKW